VPECALYAKLTEAIHSLADDIACDSPEWDAAPWNGEPTTDVKVATAIAAIDLD
jgi:hypothetical protein